PAGERVSKTAAGLTTYYVRDAQGNTLAVYDNAHTNLNWKEQELYGSSRLGMWAPNENLTTNNSLAIWDTTGHKEYELDNHLGNVLATISDKRLQHTTSGTSIDYFNADIATAQEYYPFGMLMPNRQYTINGVYRYGFNGKENDDEVKGVGNEEDYGARIYDTRVGRFLSTDPITSSYPMLSPYQFVSNRPIDGVDIDGREYGTMHINTYPEKGEAGTTYTYTPYDATQSNVTGPRGRGVIYDITTYIKKADGSTMNFTTKRFVPRQESLLPFGILPTDYGNYYG